MAPKSLKIGQIIDEVVIINYIEKKYLWEARCSCGNTVKKSGSWFNKTKSPKIKSCGCKQYCGPHKNQKVEDPKKVSIKALYKRNRSSARHNKKTWNISLEQFIELSFSNCHYCDRPPSRKYNVYITNLGRYISKHREWCDQAWILYNGIDRIDSHVGYEIGNIVPACRTCNFAKNDLSYDEFILWLRNIAKVWSNR